MSVLLEWIARWPWNVLSGIRDTPTFPARNRSSESLVQPVTRAERP